VVRPCFGKSKLRCSIFRQPAGKYWDE
jgi:hypothetical protein